MIIEAYADYVRKQPCVWCGKPAPSEQSHVGSGTNKRLHDERSCSSCSICHRRWHGAKVILNSGQSNEIIYLPFTREEKALMRQKALTQFHEWIGTLPIQKRQKIIYEINSTIKVFTKQIL